MTVQERWIDFPEEPTWCPPRESSFPEFPAFKGMTDRNRRLLWGFLKGIKVTREEIALIRILSLELTPEGTNILVGLLKKIEARGKGTRAPARGQR